MSEVTDPCADCGHPRRNHGDRAVAACVPNPRWMPTPTVIGYGGASDRCPCTGWRTMHTVAQWHEAIEAALKAHDVEAVPGLLKRMALEHPDEAIRLLEAMKATLVDAKVDS